jgi:adenosylmethionine-8-amino-7-oxononanoate aminotransferase
VSAVEVRDELLARGVIARPLGDGAIAFCPPLCIDDADVEHVLDATAASIRAVSG